MGNISTFRRLLALLLLTELVLNTLCRVNLEFDSGFEYSVIEGDDVVLVCQSQSNDSVTIFRGSMREYMIINNSVLEGNPKRYDFQFNATELGFNHWLTIRNISREDGDVYLCVRKEHSFEPAFLTVNVTFASSKPICSSQAELVFFEDEINKRIVFQCINKHNGDPSTQLSIKGFPKNMPVKTDSVRQGDILNKYVSFIPSHEINQTIITCHLRQNVTSSNKVTSFHDFCTFPPLLFLKELVMSITPPSYSITKPGKVAFTCLSNAGRNDKWKTMWKIISEIPIFVKYSISSSRLTFEVNEPLDLTTTVAIVFECSGEVRHHIAKTVASLSITHNFTSGSISEPSNLTFFLFVTAFPSVVILVLIILCYTCYKHQHPSTTPMPKNDLLQKRNKNLEVQGQPFDTFSKNLDNIQIQTLKSASRRDMEAIVGETVTTFDEYRTIQLSSTNDSYTTTVRPVSVTMETSLIGKDPQMHVPTVHVPKVSDSATEVKYAEIV